MINEPTHRVHAFCDDALGDLDSVGVAAAVAAGDISAREAAQAAVDRAAVVNPTLNAIQHPDFDRGLARSDGPLSGILAGVPSFIKDNTDVAGLPSDQGSLAVRSRPATADHRFTEQFRSTGLGVLGKTTMPEFGFNASTEWETLAPTRNPWHTDYSPGGSSGGSAALVAAGVVPIAHGNDGGGSIRIPAAACGLVGLKPTRGRVVPAAESATLPVDVVSNGVLTRTVRDTAHFMAGTQQFLPAAGMKPLGLVEGPSERRLRVGLVLDSVTGPTDDDGRRAVLATVDRLTALGHDVTEVPIPGDAVAFMGAFTHYWALLGFSTQHFGKRVMHSPDFEKGATDQLTRGLARTFWRHAWRTPGAIRVLKQSEQSYRDAFTDIDVIVSPTLGYVTPKLGHLNPAAGFEVHFDRLIRYAAFTPLNNAAGGPAISLPLAQTADGRPVGVHFSAVHGNEQTLLELAYELEADTPFARIQA
ncbi:amidase [Aeromicrobium wangtongii]|uniref:Amidase n=1 Tax=Aeromicrobium wangtongii TaxID=2969247 RepID=A0ABY5MAM9_9ACTN|nr:amidase [Aeromicrobium wangtongii]MCD9197378.1 amidase [Aeromicrobium wangtongii]UUP14872.1 amidase [Aeromicrobium wangtongii]